jgi:phospholipid/cholesterol/gamma-HCH transport system substrate-binding protein
MRRLLAIVSVFALLVGAAVLMASKSSDDASGKTYKIVFDNGFGLVKGGDFRVGGVRAGQTTDFKATDSSPPKAEVTAKVSEPGFDDLRADASCTIKPQSLIGEYYVDCQPGSSKKKLPDGGTITVQHTESTIPQDLVNNVLRRPYRERLRLIIDELGTGLAGRPQDLQAVLKRSDPGLRETQKVLRILGDQNKVIKNFITDADTSIAALEKRKADLKRFVTASANAADASASQREALAATFNKLPRFLQELQPTMARLGDVADQQIPLLRQARTVAPQLDTFLQRLGPVAQVSRPAINTLGDASKEGAAATRKGRKDTAVLRTLAADAPKLGKPLRQFLQAMDDRRRSINNDPRALVGGPPASDVSNSYSKKTGFTGLEAIWNFIYWSGMSVNGYDSISHFLRVSLTVNECSQYENDTPKHNPGLESHFKKCNQWLGPNQPNVTTPDFTDGPGKVVRNAAGKVDQPAPKLGERRAPGQLDAPALPGQQDLSKPQIVLPPAVQNLVNSLKQGLGLAETKNKVEGLLNGQAVRNESGGTPSANQLLDYLLAP